MTIQTFTRFSVIAVAAALLAPAAAQDAKFPSDIPAKLDKEMPQADFIRREVMVPMRDGVKLFTVIVMRKGTVHGPILLSRTPYNAGSSTKRNASTKITEILPIMDAEFVNDGYIRVYQDVRGRNKSEGDYVMVRPLRGPLNPTKVDHSTDAYDTIDWLVKNVPESNGKVAITGSTYLGFTSLMALIDPHPALKVAVPQSPMVDGWIGDDWFHNGAFRQPNLDYALSQSGDKDDGGEIPAGTGDDYVKYLSVGSAGDFVRKYRLEQLPFVQKLMTHPSYDAYWQEQAVDKILAKKPLTVPTMLVVGQWDQEDSYGAPAVYRAWEPKDKNNDKLFLVIGPWRHSGVNYDGSSLGPLKLPGDTALQFRRDVMKPFIDSYVKDGAPKAATPPVMTFQTGRDKWDPSKQWPMGKPTPLYLQDGFGLSFTKPAGTAAHDDYISDPAKPIPFVPRPIHMGNADVWKPWLVSDQRPVSDRTDVLVYTSESLTKTMHIAGQPMVDLFAATSGTDSDWVVKVIDVYPDEMSDKPNLAGYQLGIGMEIFRGRYVNGLDKPAALTPGKVERYHFALPAVNHAFLPGHRIMVQVQSTWFPLYDRNPQTFVPNIFDAKSGDYRKATQMVYHAGDQASSVSLPVVAE
jgi:putative CocE/NonD family hydrolase